MAIAALALAWIGILAALWWYSANPVVVNRVQVLHADLIVLGEWRPGDPPQLTVERSWKGTPSGSTVAVRQTELAIKMNGANPSGRFVVPLTRITPDLYEITQGVLGNPPEHPQPGAELRPAEVRPHIYPAGDDVIRQLEGLLAGGEGQ
jgi:hypothetical protein